MNGPVGYPTLCKYCRQKQVYRNYAYCSKTCGRADQGLRRASTPFTPRRSDGGYRRGNRSSYAPSLAQPLSPAIPADPTTEDGLPVPSGSGADPVNSDSEDAEEDARDDSRELTSRFRNPSLDSTDPSLCINCARYPKVIGYDFCSKVCRQEAANKLSQGRSQDGSSGTRAPQGPPAKACRMRGCTNSVDDPQRTYCSNECRKKAVEQGLAPCCLLCRKYPKKHSRTHFCSSTCARNATQQAPLLLDLPSSDPKFAEITKQFVAGGGGQSQQISKIYKIINTKQTEDAYQAYRTSVEVQGNFRRQRKTAGNEQRRWHGTGRACTIGDTTAATSPCTSATCAMCSIIRTSFNTAYAAMGMFGKGIYTSASSAVSNGYTRKAVSVSPYRAMFLTRIVAGQEYVWGSNTAGAGIPTSSGTLTAPPAGYHSVASDPRHSQLIVYRNDAVCPSWLVLYS